MPTPIPRTCQHCKLHRASGMWFVYTKKGDVLTMTLCAQCGMTDVVKRVRMAERKGRNGHTETIYWRDLERTELAHSFSREGGGEPEPAPLRASSAAQLKMHNKRKHAPKLHPAVTDRRTWNERSPWEE